MSDLFVAGAGEKESSDENHESKSQQWRFTMNGLLLHCGAQLKTREEVCAVPVPRATTTYAPLPYESFLTRIEKQLTVEGMRVKEERLALAHDGQRLFGLLALEMPGFPQAEYGSVLGLRTSYDKSFSTGVCIGASVFVCDNLSFRGEITFARKHTPNALRDLSWLLAETIAQLPVRFIKQSTTFNTYKQTEIADEEAHHLMIQMLDRRAVNVTDLPHLLKEWRTPRHPEFIVNGKTLWRLFNAATETVKGDLWRLPARTTAIHELLDQVCGIEAETVSKAEPETLAVSV